MKTANDGRWCGCSGNQTGTAAQRETGSDLTQAALRTCFQKADGKISAALDQPIPSGLKRQGWKVSERPQERQHQMTQAALHRGCDVGTLISAF